MSDVEVVPRWTLGDRLRKARIYADLKQSDLADELGVSSQAIGRWENGAPIKLAFVKVWAVRCGVPVDWLVSGTSNDSGGSCPQPGGLFFPEDAHRLLTAS